MSSREIIEQKFISIQTNIQMHMLTYQHYWIDFRITKRTTNVIHSLLKMLSDLFINSFQTVGSNVDYVLLILFPSGYVHSIQFIKIICRTVNSSCSQICCKQEIILIRTSSFYIITYVHLWVTASFWFWMIFMRLQMFTSFSDSYF